MKTILTILFLFYFLEFSIAQRKKFRLRYLSYDNYEKYRNYPNADELFKIHGKDIFQTHFERNNFEILDSLDENSIYYAKSNDWDL